MLDTDRDHWIQAGGSAEKASLYAKIAEIATLSSPEGRCLAAIHPDKPKVGTIGDWVGSSDLLRGAEHWLKQRGCEEATGPIEVCSWFAHGAVDGPFDDPPYTTESTDKVERWAAAGYRSYPTFLAAVAEHDAVIRSTTDRIARLSVAGWSVRQLALDPGEGRASEATFREAIHILHQLRSESYSEIPGFSYVAEDIIQASFAPLRKQIDPRLVWIAYTPQGQPAGILFGVPDLLHSDRGWFVVTTLAVLPKFRQNGLGAWLIAATHQSARKAGYRAGVHRMLWSRDHIPQRPGFRVLRRYSFMKRSL